MFLVSAFGNGRKCWATQIARLALPSANAFRKGEVPSLPPPSPYLVRSDGAELRLESDVLNMGRAPDNHVVVNDKRVSRRHAVLKREGANYVLEDMGTPNGTFVNNQRIQCHILVSGDVIRLDCAIHHSPL